MRPQGFGKKDAAMNTTAPRTVPLVEITPESHDVLLDIRYATADNIAGRALYRAPRLFLRAEAERALRRAARLAAAAGLRLVLFDGFRPAAAQALLWEACPDETYVCPPSRGSAHTRGVAVDLTLAEAGGAPLEMGAAFDEMSPRAHPACTEISPRALRNRMLLAGVMGAAGFRPIESEWWHFQLPGEWPLLSDESLPAPLMA